MAARRLIIIMLVLLGISTLLAAALPDRVRENEENATSTSETSATATQAAGTEASAEPAQEPKDAEPCKTVLKCFELDADSKKVQVLPVAVGDQLVLEVSSTADDTVEIGELGYLDVVGPGNPATFDVLADRPGSYGIRLIDAARTIGRIEVTG